MARISLCRILFLAFIVLPACFFLTLVLLWAGLPAPNFRWNKDPTEYLQNGGVLTRVYEVPAFYSRFDGVVRRLDIDWRQYFALDYQLQYDRNNGSMHLRVSEHTLNLTHYVNLPGKTSDPSESHLSEPMNLEAKMGDLDGINLPWFSKADGALLFWYIHRDTIDIPVRVRVSNSVVEIWADSSQWGHDDPINGGLTSPLEPLIMIHNISPNLFNPTNIRLTLPEKNYNSTPSQTFGIRLFIQTVLVWIHEHFGWIEEVAEFLFKFFLLCLGLFCLYSFIVLGFWHFSGRPTFRTWAQTHSLTYKVYDILGGYIDKNHETAPRLTRKPKPLSNPFDFFRSASPLDDLWATFEFTKPLLRPLGLSRGRQEEDEPRTTGVERIIKLRVHRRGSPSKDLEVGSRKEYDGKTET